MKVKSISIYPIKSLKGINMNSHETFEEGFKWDRRWMLVDEQGKFITQRSYPQLSLLKCSISEDQLIVSSARLL